LINKIAHLADIHIRKSLDRHNEYREVFKKLYTDLKKERPDRIVIVGDIYDNFIDLEGEALILVGEFITKLSNIAKIIITRGNHDIRKKHKTRIDTIETVTTLIKNTGVTYYNKSGFYVDENITWVIWDHVDEINPWKQFKKRKTKDSIYIDLYHNPINGCSLYNGMIIEGNYPKISDFKGDYSFFGDIHLRQFFKNKTKAYCSSLIQQNFGESVENHGYLLWDIKNKTVKEKNIDNDYKFVNITIDTNTDYDNLKMPINIDKNNKTKIKIKWEDFGVNMNSENERKLRNLIKENVGSDLINIENHPLYTDINDNKLLSDTIDINDKIVQQNILKEFLKGNNIDNEIISDIVNIDNIINDRLNINISSNIKWNIDKLWFNNFKSYGDKNIIDWKDKNGIIQISGINQQGKSTILDAICYIIYGATLSTSKREKHGDNRFININRNKNYCDGGAIIDIDGEKFLIYRKTTRKLKKNGDISSCSTKLEYYKGTKMIEENKLVGEKRVDTQKQLDSILGDFNDFIRLTLTNADNINDLLSMDRSIFIDNIIKDAGFDIFDKKLNEFKDYKKSLNLDKINIDINKIEDEVNKLNKDIDNYKNELNSLENEIESNDKKIKSHRNNKEELIGKLNKIDNDIMKIDYDKLSNDIEINENEINEINNNIISLNKDIIDLPTSFNEESSKKLEQNKEWYNKFNSALSDTKIYIKDIENEILSKEYELKDNNDKTENKLESIKNDINDKIKSYETDIRILENDINNIKRDGSKIKKEINNLENTNDRVCPTCLRPLDENDNEHFKIEISKRKLELKKLISIINKKSDSIKNIKNKIQKLNDIKIEESDEYLSFIYNINNNIDNINEDIKKLKNKIDKRKEKIKKASLKINDVKNTINNLEKNKNDYNKRLIIESKIKDFKISIKDKIENNNRIKDKIKKYENNKISIIENIKINKKIDGLTHEIDEMTKNSNNLRNKQLDINKNLIIKRNTIKTNNELIDKYKKQEKLDFIHTTYMKSMHRDGLPTYLLKKSIHIINDELMILLSNLDFNLLFDDNLNLKMKSKINGKTYNAVEGSGMERTFNACTLKMALRRINNTSKPNIILFDEIMNKLVDKSVEEFTELLYELKNHIDKIIIIEHIHQMKYDYLISVKKDKNGISSFELY